MFRDYEVLLVACVMTALLQLSDGMIDAAFGTLLGYTFALLLHEPEADAALGVAETGGAELLRAA